MLAATGRATVASCIAADSPSGSVTIGTTAVPTGDTNLQLGLLQTKVKKTITNSIVSPAGGVLVAAPAQVPGGLLGLMCPSSIPVISQICQTLVNNPLNTVTAEVQPAGAPSNLNLGAQFQVGQPIVSIPIKIQLVNPVLGSSCFIGSDTNPIVLQPENLTAPTFGGELFDTNGTPDPNGSMELISLNGTLGDSTFSVPAASGCGGALSLIITPIVNLKLGLPSPSGGNSAVLRNATTDSASFLDPTTLPREGKALSKAWHSAVTG
jgi:hypothetical protein